MTTPPARGGVAPSAAREIELKLLAADADLEGLSRWAAARWRLLAPLTATRVRTIYHDTPSLDLAAAGVAVRLRQDGGRWLLALKTRGAEPSADRAAVAVRREWELPLEGPEFDPAAIDRIAGGDLAPAGWRANLAPRFETIVTRDRLLLSPIDGVVVEMSIDRGEAVAREAAATIGEIELELKEGPVGALFDLALDLHARIPLRIGVENKADVGLRLLTGRKPQAAAAPPLGLSRLSTGTEALRHELRAAIRHLLANLPAAEAGDAEAMTQMRAALRRLRPALRPFGAAPLDAEMEKLLDHRRWLSARLAAPPGWSALLDRLATEGGAPPALLKAAAAMRRDAGTAAARTLRSPRFTTFMLTLARRVEDDRRHAFAWGGNGAENLSALLEQPATTLAAVRLDRLAARCRKPLRRLAAGRDDDADPLRRRLQRLLDGVDVYRGLFPSAATHAFIESPNAVAAALNCRRRSAAARRRLAELTREYPETRAPAAHWMSFFAKEEEEALRSAARLCQTLTPLPPFWRS